MYELFLCSSRSPKTTLTQCCRPLNSENWVNHSAMNYRCPRFQICIIRNLIISAFHKNVQKLFASESVHVFDLPKTVFHSMASFDHFQNQLSKSGKVYSEAVHRKLTLKVPSTNICNKTCWHRSPSVCDDASEVHSHFALFIVVWPFNEEANPGDYQIRLLVFQTTEASRVHLYMHLAAFFFSWNVNVKLIALGPAIVVLFQSCFVLFYPIVTLSFFTDICQHFLTAKLTKNVYYLFIFLFYFMGSVCLFVLFFSCYLSGGRLSALASTLGPFGVYLLTFNLPGSLMHYLGSLEFPVIWLQSLKTPGLSITFGTLSANRTFEAKDYWTFSHCFQRVSSCSRVYMYVHGMRYITSRQNAQWSRRKRL